ncbi:class I SAM-dependent methyltransferase [Chryseobacterium jejuense]|uniref:Malonyl-CoA O-methyltransferase BioC n=1 Tax=Chryseobacterium jejuense TaxID=445960 RepID=A0A2X2WUY4_CHRJE|nr:class I SAM-dependent methyltransferase [Chryseobacterium jejuense]SDI30714.1 Ubiquinone/menaquinone biosynthesis C-methylase UbiE [Chryseobacterium jejuense]SQB44716.1 Malonyl-CoA O-methyltransferase BioC [Chryseobacterium jejuense]
MKQNIYDNPEFFSGYKALRDGDKGLNDLLEQPVIKRLMQPIKDKTILDMGCGLGHQVRELLKQNPKQITGLDISQKMLNEAQSRTSSSIVEWVCSALEDFDFGINRFDLVISSMTLHYIENLDTLFQKIYDGLNAGGQFLFSMEHPICTAALKPWQELNGEKYWPINHYSEETLRKQDWFVKNVEKYHHQLSTIVNALLKAGFILKNLEEPSPAQELLQLRPDFEQHIHRPPIVIMNVEKN